MDDGDDERAVDSAGTASGNFTGHRWFAGAGVTGTYAWAATVFEPSARVYMLWEQENAYTDSLGTLQASHTFDTGRGSAGMKVSHDFGTEFGAFVPYVGLYGDYYFSKDDASIAATPGLTAVPLLQGGAARATGGIMVKFGGPVVRLNIAKLDAAKLNSASVRHIFARYADCMLAQVFQSTACNAIHSIEQRTAKWIISAMERADGDNIVPLTHEQLATLLGVGRSYASRVIQTFKAEGVLATRRGAIVVRNPEALRLRACLCNDAVKGHFEEVLRGVYPDPAKDN